MEDFTSGEFGSTIWRCGGVFEGSWLEAVGFSTAEIVRLRARNVFIGRRRGDARALSGPLDVVRALLPDCKLLLYFLYGHPRNGHNGRIQGSSSPISESKSISFARPTVPGRNRQPRSRPQFNPQKKIKFPVVLRMHRDFLGNPSACVAVPCESECAQVGQLGEDRE